MKHLTIFIFHIICISAKTFAQNDTTIIYEKINIPKGVKKCIRLNSAITEEQIFFINGLVKKNKLFLKPIKVDMEVNKKPYADSCIDKYISISGISCAVSGGITGMGCGECGGPQVGKKIIIKVIIK